MSNLDHWHCSAIDCPLHPVYKENERRAAEKRRKAEEARRAKEMAAMNQDGTIFIGDDGQLRLTINDDLQIVGDLRVSNINANSVFGGYACDSTGWTQHHIDSSAMTIKTDYLDYPVPIECLMCSNMEKQDMRNVIIVQKAKKALEEN